MNRRQFLLTGAAAATGCSRQPGPIERTVFLASPEAGTAVMAFAYYLEPTGASMISLEQRWSRSDTVDVAYYRRSSDHGRTWGEPETRITGERRPEGMLRRHPRGFWVDPQEGKAIELWTEGVLPSDDPLEGLRQWNIYYRQVGSDVALPVVHRGPEFDESHPLPGVWRGKNCVMLGDQGSQPVKMRDGRILLPVQITPLAPDGSLYNPGAGYTWTDAAVLTGRWAGDRIEWELSDLVRGDPARTTRGMVEPTLAELAGGRLLMVMRGSNDRNPDLPAHKWAVWSEDGGKSWTKPEPWTDTRGQTFYSPSACSLLLAHSSGRLFWLGNITDENPKGNRPRYPFQVAEVDRETGLLLRDSIRVVDDRSPDESELLTLSNFYAREDREMKGIALHMTRLFALKDGWKGDAYLYRIPV